MNDLRTFQPSSSSEMFVNKTINADNNTITNLKLNSFKTGVISTDVNLGLSDTVLSTQKAVKNYVDSKMTLISGVKISANDTTSGNLFDKIFVTSKLVKTINNPGSSEQLLLDVVPSNISINQLSGTLNISSGGTGRSSFDSLKFLTTNATGQIESIYNIPDGVLVGTIANQTLTNKTYLGGILSGSFTASTPLSYSLSNVTVNSSDYSLNTIRTTPTELGFFNTPPISQFTAIVPTAGASYTSVEQGIINTLVQLVTNYGLLNNIA